MKIPASTRYFTLLGALVLTYSLPMQAAVITWGAATTISADTDINATGVDVGAFNFGALANPTVNGIGFSGIEPGAPWGNNATAFGSASGDFSALSAPYQTLLQSASFQAGPATFGFTGLTIGQEYQFQIWTNDSRTLAATRSILVGGSVTLGQNVSGTDGGLGQFVIGTWTADATTQDIIVSSEDSVLVNGYRLAAVPEPATAGLLGLAGAVLAIAMRRRKIC